MTTETQATNETAQSATNIDAVAVQREPRLQDLLPTDLANDPSIRDIPDVATLAKVAVDAKKFIGSSVRLPTADTSPESKKDFFAKIKDLDGVIIAPTEGDADSVKLFNAKLGIPESESGYKYTFNEGDDVPTDEYIREFNKFAHESGLTQKQADTMLRRQLAEIKADAEAANAKTKATESKLKELYGQAYDQKMANTNKAIELMRTKFGDSMDELVNSGAIQNAAVLSMLADLGSTLAETSTVGVTVKSAVKTPADSLHIINEIRNNPNHPYNLAYHQDHAQAVKDMTKLYEMAYPSNNQAR